MGARKLNINPTTWAVAGTYEGLKYDGIHVIPLLEKEKILFTIITENGEHKKIDEVSFPVKDQTEERYVQIIKRVIGKRLMVLL